MNNQINTIDLLNYIKNLQTEKSLSLNEAYNIFIEHCKLRKREATYKFYQTKLRYFINYFLTLNITNTSQIDNKVINDYVKTKINKVKNITINKEIIALTSMLNYLKNQDLISEIHYKYEKLPEAKPKISTINEQDIIKIINHFNSKECRIDSKNKLIFLLILTTGVRTNELRNITNDNIDLEKKRILLSFTKTHMPRYIYIVDEIIPLIKEIKSDKLYLFNDINGEQITTNTIRMFFRHLKENLNIEILSPHKLRHYYATNIYKKSLDIYLVSKLLGHSNIKTTEIYLDVDEQENQLKNEIYNPIKDMTQGLLDSSCHK